MCGRTSCTLNKDVVPLACSAVTPQVPKWKEAPCGGHYETSTNLPPTAYTPVLFQGKKLYLFTAILREQFCILQTKNCVFNPCFGV